MERSVFHRSVQLFSLITLTLTLAACGQQGPSVEPYVDEENLNTVLSTSYGQASKIIGENTMIPIKADGSNLESNLRQSLDAFGVIALGSAGICSGTHLGNGYVLTAGHCFFDSSAMGTKIVQNKTCESVKVYWGYRGSPATGSPKPVVSQISQCTKIIYAEQTQQRDFAVIKVDIAPKARIGLAQENKRTNTGTKLTIFGYPQGRPLEWSQYCSLQSSQMAGLSSIKGPSSFVYTCDTEPGNSGSAVLAVSTTGQLKVVGVHDGAAPTGIDYNYATYVFDARSVLKAKGFDLDRAIAPAGAL